MNYILSVLRYNMLNRWRRLKLCFTRPPPNANQDFKADMCEVLRQFPRWGLWLLWCQTKCPLFKVSGLCCKISCLCYKKKRKEKKRKEKKRKEKKRKEKKRKEKKRKEKKSYRSYQRFHIHRHSTKALPECLLRLLSLAQADCSDFCTHLWLDCTYNSSLIIKYTWYQSQMSYCRQTRPVPYLYAAYRNELVQRHCLLYTSKYRNGAHTDRVRFCIWHAGATQGVTREIEAGVY